MACYWNIPFQWAPRRLLDEMQAVCEQGVCLYSDCCKWLDLLATTTWWWHCSFGWLVVGFEFWPVPHHYVNYLTLLLMLKLSVVEVTSHPPVLWTRNVILSLESSEVDVSRVYFYFVHLAQEIRWIMKKNANSLLNIKFDWDTETRSLKNYLLERGCERAWYCKCYTNCTQQPSFLSDKYVLFVLSLVALAVGGDWNYLQKVLASYSRFYLGTDEGRTHDFFGPSYRTKIKTFSILISKKYNLSEAWIIWYLWYE